MPQVGFQRWSGQAPPSRSRCRCALSAAGSGAGRHQKKGRPKAAFLGLDADPDQLNSQPKFTPISYWCMEIDGAWVPVNAPGPLTVSSGAYMPQKVSS